MKLPKTNPKAKNLISLIFSLLICTCLYSQNFTVNVENLKAGDSVLVIAKKGVGSFFKKWINSTDNPNATSFNLDDGDWAIKIEAARYTYPSQKVVSIPNDTAATFALTEMLEGDYTYNWIDDESAAGHATQSYIAEPTEIIVLNDTVSVPSDFTSIKLRTEYGIILSDDKEKWSNEDAYRLYKMFSNLPYNVYGEGNSLDFSSGENVRGVFYLSEDEIYEDISIENRDGIKHATVSQSAFTYAEPQIVTIDGIRGKFYSKRLYHTVVNFITDFGNDNEVLAWLALERFGIRFLTPNDFDTFLEEDSSNFQEFYNSEKLEILSMFEELPEGFHKQDGLKNLIRRIDGQDHPDPAYRDAAAIAWTSLETLEFMSKAFIGGNLSDTRRLILHEKSHFLWAYSFDQTTKDDWAEIGGWFLDPTSPSGWSTYQTTEFVSAYAHLKNPNEDMAESVAFYLTNPDLLIGVSPLKFEFIRDRIMHGTRYVSIIQEDLTFTVYNLFPDYTFPGKIVELDLSVEGDDEEDKTVTMTVRLASTNPEVDGATFAYTRFNSSIGTNFDIQLHPQNGSIDSVLVGTATLNKHAKSGYWNMSSISVTDQVGNKRYENTSTVGAKLFIQNPLEDITPPEFIEFSMTRIDSTFNSNGNPDPTGTEGQAIKLNSKWEEPLQLSGNGAVVRIDFPNPDQAETYFTEAGTYAKDPDTFLKDVEGYFFIEDYYPSGYYGVVQMYTGDIAGNGSNVTFINNLENFPYTDIGNVAALRDSVFVETLYPDIIKPEIDLNNITVIAEPTNPVAPNGETRVDINFNARDLSDFPGHESGIYIVNLTLRDPQGRKTGYQTGNGTMNHPDLDLNDTEPVLDSLWRNYRFDLVLPQGSAPGEWGISDIVVIDKVGNTKSYNFEEYVRFDIIESDIELDVPLEIEIIDKVVNAGNVTAIKAKMSCTPCAGLNFVATIYSRFGGGAVVRSEGVLESDEVIVENLDTSGILDGEVNLTVQITDADNRLVATKTTAYTKDVVYPKAYYSRSNLENEGTSSLDDWVIEVVIESVDINGTYNLDIDDANTSESGRVQSLSFEGDLSSEITVLENLDISNLENGDYKFDLKVTDPNGNLGESEILYYRKGEETITLLGSEYVSNNAPISVDGSTVKDEDTPQIINLSASDVDGDELTYTIGTAPTNGTVTLTGAEVVYTPNENFNGTDSFTFTSFDGTIESNLATIIITVNPVNDAPVAQDGSNTKEEDTDQTITLSASDVDGDDLTYTIGTAPTNGTVTLTGAEVVYTPNENFNGTDSFTFTSFDGTIESNAGTVAITVTAVNDAPVAQDGSNTKEEDTDQTITLSASDVDGDELTYTIGTAPTNGTVTLTGAEVVYTPNENFNGTDSFTFTSFDGTIESNAGTVAITVTAVNDAPVAQDGSNTKEEDTDQTITLSASDVDGDELTYTIGTAPTNGTVTLTGAEVVYTPNENFNGTDSFTFTSFDGTIESNLATIIITVNPVNDAPVAQDGSNTKEEDTDQTITLSASDVDGDELTYTIGTAPTNGTVTLTGAEVVYTPNENFNGTDSFTFTSFDGTIESNAGTVAITVTAVNDAPVAQDGSNTKEEDTDQTITLSASDVDGDELTYTIGTAPTNGTVTLTGAEVVYTPNENFNGTDSFTFTSFDGTIESNAGTVAITVTAVNDAPVAQDGSNTKEEDTDQTITLSASDVDGDELTYTIGTAPTNGTVTLTGAEVVYTPNENFNGTDSFTFTSFDGTIESNAGTVAITVTAVNDAPVAQDGSNTKEEDTDQTITLSASDVDGDELTYTIGTAPTNGTVTLTGAEVVYTPNENFNGTDSFTFTSSDGTIESNLATIIITVNPVNDAPVAQDGSNTKEEDTDQTITLSASDVDGDELTYTIGTAPTNGTVTLTGAEVVYTPNENFNGTDSFTFTSFDGTIESNLATIIITVNPVNDAPVAQDGSNTKEEDTDQTITLSASDVDGDELTYTIGTAPTNGTVTLTGAEVVYTPNENFNGTDSFTFTSFDGTIESNLATIIITVNPVNDAPVAQDGSNTKEEDTDQTITLSASDVDGDELTYTIGTAPTNGTVTLTGAEVVYTPNENFNGTDSFTFTSFDGTIESNAGTLAITVTAVNDAPVAQDGSNTKEEDTDQTITLSASDVDGDELTYTIGTAPTNGTVTLTGAEVVYTPNENFNGTDSFTFTSSDGTIESNAGTVAITVTAVNDAPVAQDGSNTKEEDTDQTITLSASDVDGDELTYTIGTAPTNGTVTLTGAEVVYTPNENFNGTDSFTFTSFDGTIESNAGTVAITVTAVNDAPVAQDGSEVANSGVTITFSLIANDVDGDILTYTIVNQPSNGSITIDGNLASYTSDIIFLGEDSFTFSVTDGELTSNPATVSINVILGTLGELEFNLNNVKSYPNPVDEFYMIESALPLKVEIYDVNGRILIRKNLDAGENKIDASDLASGYYILKMHHLTKSASRILIKR